jgi:hypothetical protein
MQNHNFSKNYVIGFQWWEIEKIEKCKTCILRLEQTP